MSTIYQEFQINKQSKFDRIARKRLLVYETANTSGKPYN